MPFRVSENDLSLPKPVLKVVDIKSFQLCTAFQYVDRDSKTVYDVPAHTGESTTDLASVPALLWGLVAPYGHQLLPALMHDARCDVARAQPPSASPPPREIRADADRMFREALQDRRVPWTRRWLMWAAVTQDGLRKHDMPKFVLLVLEVLALYAAAWYGATHLHGWMVLSVLAGPLALGLLLPGQLAAAAAGFYGIPPMVVVLVVTLVASGLIWLLPSGAWWLLCKVAGLLPFVPSPGAPPIFGPNALRFRMV